MPAAHEPLLWQMNLQSGVQLGRGLGVRSAQSRPVGQGTAKLYSKWQLQPLLRASTRDWQAGADRAPGGRTSTQPHVAQVSEHSTNGHVATREATPVNVDTAEASHHAALSHAQKGKGSASPKQARTALNADDPAVQRALEFAMELQQDSVGLSTTDSMDYADMGEFSSEDDAPSTSYSHPNNDHRPGSTQYNKSHYEVRAASELLTCSPGHQPSAVTASQPPVTATGAQCVLPGWGLQAHLRQPRHKLLSSAGHTATATPYTQACSHGRAHCPPTAVTHS